jgi:MFS family permease
VPTARNANARFIDQVGKGIRGAPRDALVADIAPPHLRGACYGLRQSLDTVGAFVGPLLAVVLMAAFANDIRLVFFYALSSYPAACSRTGRTDARSWPAASSS